MLFILVINAPLTFIVTLALGVKKNSWFAFTILASKALILRLACFFNIANNFLA